MGPNTGSKSFKNNRWAQPSGKPGLTRSRTKQWPMSDPCRSKIRMRVPSPSKFDYALGIFAPPRRDDVDGCVSQSVWDCGIGWKCVLRLAALRADGSAATCQARGYSLKIADWIWRECRRGNATWILSLRWRPGRVMMLMARDPRVLKCLSPQHTFAIFSNSVSSHSLISSRCVS